MITPTDTSEKGFQKHILKALHEENAFEISHSDDFDREFCLNRNQLFRFLEETQLDIFQYIQQKGERTFLARLDKRIKEKGIIEVLRKGIKLNDKTIMVFYKQPNSLYNMRDKKRFDANIFSVTEELIYTDNNRNRLDLTVFVNGLPILTTELKNAFTHQAVKDAIKQYKEDRNPKDKIFNKGRCMVHFAADTQNVFMTGSLAKDKTAFFPFNKGLNEGKPHPPFGAGNPADPEGIKTRYLWKEILTKTCLSNIIEKFAALIEKKDEETGKEETIQIFPRYHQLMVVQQMLHHAKTNGVGHRYLVQHSAGSGKSNSITWLAHQLTSLYDERGETPLFDSIVVVTDRTVLDRQIRNNIKAFAQVKRIVEGITGEARDIKALDPNEDTFSKTTHMRLALANNKKIITCTVQTFPHVLKVVQDMPTKNVAIVIDEAHSSQSGEAAASLNALFADLSSEAIPKDESGNISTEDLLNYLIEGRRMLSNASYFAFTATPKNKTLETFGSPQEYQNEHGELKRRFLPFHTYSMKQAIEEEFILDVLKYYTPWKSFYKVKEKAGAEGDELFDTQQANKKIRTYVEGHELAINEKSRIMIDHFNKHSRHRIDNKAKAMVVCRSIESAMKYKEGFDAYLKEINSPMKTIVAFSGKKKHWKTGEEMSEESMNNFPDNNNDIPKQFQKNEYRFLIVADKFQTGFDQPLLHTMYVDKQLRDVQAVQTLSRLNRAKKPEKSETLVVDFYNTRDEIKEAFQPYYTTTILSEETDPNKLNDLQELLDDTQIYDEESITQFFIDYYDANTDREVIDKSIAHIQRNFYEDLTKDQQIEFKANAKSFVRTYSYLSRLLDFKNQYWEKLWLLLKRLIPFLKIEEEQDEENILEVVDMDSYRTRLQSEMSNIALESEQGYIPPIPVQMGGMMTSTEYDTLDAIIEAFNRRFALDDEDMPEGVDRKDAEELLGKTIPEKLMEHSDGLQAIKNSDKTNARHESNDLVLAEMKKLMMTNTGLFKMFIDDDNFKNRYQEFIFDILWTKVKNELRK